MSYQGLQLQSVFNQQGDLSLVLEPVDFPAPKAGEVLIEMEAAPVNPSDMFTLFSSLNPQKAEAFDYQGRPASKIVCDHGISDDLKLRLGTVFKPGNEGAGRVVAAGEGDYAQSLIGKRVGVVGGEMYANYRAVLATNCFVFADDVSPVQACSPFVNPMTALSMVGTMEAEGHKAMIHNAAASNLGQMLNRVCLEQGIDLINLVRRDAQAELLKSQGARYVINTQSETFLEELTEAVYETKASLAFDPVFGGDHVGVLIQAMETAFQRDMTDYGGYSGNGRRKQVYVYGILNVSPMVLPSNLNLNWSISTFLVNQFLEQAGTETILAMKQRVVDGITTTFASEFVGGIPLTQAAAAHRVQQYTSRATANKYYLALNQ